jgi:hypothetical protein
MKKHTIESENEELEQLNCSNLMDEVREKVQLLKDYGLSESEIVSHIFGSQSQPQKLVIKNYRIFLGDECKEVHLEPLVRSVYLLFLKHPEGIMFKNLPDYRQELCAIYNKVRPWGLTDRAIRSIEDVTNPVLNSINEKCARIKKVFLNLLDSRMAENYCIRGKRGEAKKISLPRDLVIWE